MQSGLEALMLFLQRINLELKFKTNIKYNYPSELRGICYFCEIGFYNLALKLYKKIMTLKNADELIFQPLGMKLSNIEEDVESKDYSGCSFTLNQLKIKFRTAKITPTKTGQFVTIWKRNEKGQTAPFDSSDPFDFYLISASTNNNRGIFIFSKDILLEKGILSHGKRMGKRGIRVYPDWDLTESKQAIATQKWQTVYFIDLSQFQVEESHLQKVKILLELK
jgi:hypothetical protein